MILVGRIWKAVEEFSFKRTYTHDVNESWSFERALELLVERLSDPRYAIMEVEHSCYHFGIDLGVHILTLLCVNQPPVASAKRMMLIPK
jgi:hypothetical protein